MKDGKPLGKTVEPNRQDEKLFRERAIKTAYAHCADSGRVVAGGGLAAALANEASASGVGMNITAEPKNSTEALLFSEGGARAVYSVPADKASEFETIWEGFPCANIGTAGGDTLSWKDLFEIALSDIRMTFMGDK